MRIEEFLQLTDSEKRGVKTLDCSERHDITELPELPDSLELLDCHGCNELKKLPELPDSLLSLYCYGCNLDADSKDRVYCYCSKALS